MISICLQVLIAWLYSHIAEYSIHRWILHKFAAKKGRLFSFHWRGHHRDVRLNDFVDRSYFGNPFKISSAGKELFSLFFLVVIHLPLVFYFPWAFSTLCLCIASYYYVHRRAHRDPAWACEKLHWHYEHHMALNQNANYGVRSDIIDRIARTRESAR